MAAKKIPERTELPEDMIWDLTKIYISDEEWQKDFEKIEEKIKPFSKFKGKLKTSASLLAECLKAVDEIKRIIKQMLHYHGLNPKLLP
jgi:oligoendopeptidase F